MEDNVNVEEALLEEEDEVPTPIGAMTFDEDEIIPPECNLSDSDNEVDDDGFLYDTNAPERVAVVLNADLTIELEAEKYNPQLEIGKEFKNIEEFRQAVRNHGVATRYSFRFRPNGDERAQARCKEEGCKFKIWASLKKAKGCIQIKSENSEQTCTRDRTNRHCTTMYITKRYLDTFKIEPSWKTSLIKKVVNDDVKLTINNVTVWRARKYARILLEGSDEH
ncbi:Uncharacterized protein Adt_41888 [Abeliophyllum distichum]|uniref:Transposase MuDR plant domain-containing protein n=1 Tax=Abeliophyllum distichum TaxID=126358 RepID=A0ABD1PQ57_9LAMI